MCCNQTYHDVRRRLTLHPVALCFLEALFSTAGSNQHRGIPSYSGHFPVDVTLASIWKTSNNHTNLFPPLGSACLYLKILSLQAEQVKDGIHNNRNCGQILFLKKIYLLFFERYHLAVDREVMICIFTQLTTQVEAYLMHSN